MSTTSSWMAIAFKANLKDHPETFTLTDEQVGAIASSGPVMAVREANQKNQEGKPQPLKRDEYNRLRRELYYHQQNAKNCEIRVNVCASDIREIEKMVTLLITKRKTAKAANLIHEERGFENQLARKEEELRERKDDYVRLRAENKAAVTGLQEFNHARLQELAEELGE